jgi:NADPH:quinone reductase-like Zn-dependent oxidoreductase
MDHSALWYRQFGDPQDVLQLETGPAKPLVDGMVRVCMQAAPINPSDLIPITGAYRHRVQPPKVAGYEGLGVIGEINAAQTGAFRVGQRVLPLRADGTWQSFVDCDPAWLVAVPDNVPNDIAMRGYINPLAAFLMLDLWSVVGKNILVTAAGSSCANLIIQWAIAAGAKSVCGIHRSLSRLPVIRELGAHPVSIEDTAAINDAAAQCDLVFDAVGGDLARTLLSAMPENSRLISYGLLSGQLFALPENAKAGISRFHLRDRLATVSPRKWQGWFDRVWPLLTPSNLPPVHGFDLADWQAALDLFERPGRAEKPVLLF